MAENPLKKVGRFVTDEMLGIDDFGRVFTKAASGDVTGALKSAGAGVLELGSTVLTGGAGTVAKQGLKAGAKAAVKQGTKETVEAGVKAGAKGATVKGSPGPSDIMGAQFKPVAPKTKPAVKPGKPGKPGDLPGAPGYPRTPTKPGDLPGAPGYPVTPKPLPKPLPKPQPKPATKPAPKPAPAPAPAPKPAPKPAKGTKTKKDSAPKGSTSTAPKTGPAAKIGPQFKNAAKFGVPAAVATALLLPKDNKPDGTWNPSAIV